MTSPPQRFWRQQRGQLVYPEGCQCVPQLGRRHAFPCLLCLPGAVLSELSEPRGRMHFTAPPPGSPLPPAPTVPGSALLGGPWCSGRMHVALGVSLALFPGGVVPISKSPREADVLEHAYATPGRWSTPVFPARS